MRHKIKLKIIQFEFMLFTIIPGIDDIKAQQLNAYLKKSIPVRSIDPADENFSDLQALKSKIGNASVVVLGEISHTDGASFAAKSRMVKFLHKEMGFDVLAWEAGFLDAYNMNEALANDSTLKAAKNYFMSGGWASSEYVNPVFEFAQQSWKTKRPLIMAGFDAGRPAKGYSNADKVIKTAFADCKYKISEAEKVLLDSVLRATFGYIGNTISKNISLTARRSGKMILQLLIDSLKPENSKTKYLLRSIIMDVELENIRTISTESWNILRDKFMADRFLWLMNYFYPGKKIIIWAASGHLIKDSRNIQRLEPHPNFTDSVVMFPQMGYYLDKWLGSNLYTIAFTSFKGYTGLEYPDGHRFKSSSFKNELGSKDEESLESLAHKLKMDFLFIDLKNMPEAIANKRFIAYPFGFSKDYALWNKVIDAFFFIDSMYPDRNMQE